jgi:hypothetical protein
VFGSKWEELTGEWRKLHELNDVYFSLDMVRVIKSTGMRWAGAETIVDTQAYLGG